MPNAHTRRYRRPPSQQELPFEDDDVCAANLTIGTHEPYIAPLNPFRVCITPTQWQRLFPGRRRGSVPEPIGKGVFATVYPYEARNALTETTAIKITNDASDALGFKRAAAAGILNIPRLYSVNRLASPTNSPTPVFALKVERIKGTLKEVYPELAKPLRCLKTEGRGSRAQADALAAMCCNEFTPVPRTKRKSVAVNRDAFVGAMCTKLARQIPPTIKKLSDIGIEVESDLHANNVGVTYSNDFVIHDLGSSGQVTGRNVAPTLAGAKAKRRRRR